MFNDFFKFPGQYSYDGSDLMSAKQFIVTGTLLAIIIFLSIFLRKANHKKITIFLRVMSIVLPVLEASKMFYAYLLVCIKTLNLIFLGIFHFILVVF